MLNKMMVDRYGPFMDIQELADVLKISKGTLYNQLYANKVDMPYVKRGKRYLFLTTGVAESLQAGMCSSCMQKQTTGTVD